MRHAAGLSAAGWGTLWRTVRHLRARQVWGRVWFRLYKPRPDLRPAPAPRARSSPCLAPAGRDPSLLGPQRLRFLNEVHELDEVGWDDEGVELLWRYNLHYFDDLNALGAASRRAWHTSLVTRWVAENPPGQGTAWQPYPTSLRIVNWIKWFCGGQAPQAAWLDSLAAQVRWLGGRLEWHLLGNHLFANAKALVAAGLYFSGPEADVWLHRGLAILERELPEQILPDGGHFERSPMYHALALEDLLDLIQLWQAHAADDSSPPAWVERLRTVAAGMLAWLRCMSHGNGELARFNDCADGIAPRLSELERVAAMLGIVAARPAPGRIHLADSGYIRVTDGQVLLLADVAPLGPDYLVGHAHADTLSFELSLGPRRLVVNGGTSCYGNSPRRLVERGTAAHSTVEVAGLDSSEVWSGFRVGRRARPLALQLGDGTIRCAHDGYRHLRGRPLHQRSWQLSSQELRVDDHLSGSEEPALARYPLAPGLTLQALPEGGFAVHDGPLRLAIVQVDAGQPRVVDSLYAQHFGVVLPNQTLTVRLQDGHAATRWRWITDAHPLSH